MTPSRLPKNVTYTNTSAEPVNLELAVSVQDEEGNPAPSGMVTVAPAELTLGSGGSAEVQVTVDMAVGDPSLYGGYLTATEDDGGVTRVPVGFYKEPERHTISIDLIGRDGSEEFDFGIVTLLRVDEGEFFGDFFFLEPGEDHLEVRVPPGVYSAMAMTSAEDGDTFELVHFGDPQFEIGTDTTVTLDARSANEILVEAPEPTTLSDADLISTRESADGSVSFVAASGVSGFSDIHVFAAPTETVTVGYFEQDAKQVRIAGPESLYDLFFIEPDRIPEDLSYQVTDDNWRLSPNASMPTSCSPVRRVPHPHLAPGRFRNGVGAVHRGAPGEAGQGVGGGHPLVPRGRHRREPGGLPLRTHPDLRRRRGPRGILVPPAGAAGVDLRVRPLPDRRHHGGGPLGVHRR